MIFLSKRYDDTNEIHIFHNMPICNQILTNWILRCNNTTDKKEKRKEKKTLLYTGGGGGHICLNLDFLQTSCRFTRDFTTTDKNFQKCLISYVKNIYFNRKSVEV